MQTDPNECQCGPAPSSPTPSCSQRLAARRVATADAMYPVLSRRSRAGGADRARSPILLILVGALASTLVTPSTAELTHGPWPRALAVSRGAAFLAGWITSHPAFVHLPGVFRSRPGRPPPSSSVSPLRSFWGPCLVNGADHPHTPMAVAPRTGGYLPSSPHQGNSVEESGVYGPRSRGRRR